MKDKIVFSKGSGKKKYKASVFRNGKLIKTASFGHKDYEQFKDKTPLKLYSYLDHGDPERRKKYLKRAKGIKNKKEQKTWKIKYTPNWFSVHYLW